jgi:ABC-type uncharacterized transport system involved in gliding motility auxiliary subunit
MKKTKSSNLFPYGIPAPITIFFYIFFALGATLLPGYIDVTQDKRFKLPDSLITELENLDREITVRLFVTKQHTQFGFDLARYERRIIETLVQLNHASDEKISFEVLDPNLDSRAARIAVIDEIESSVYKDGEPFMFGLVVESLDKKHVFNSIDPKRERYFLSDLAQVILDIGKTEKKTIGVLTPFTANRDDAVAAPYWSGINILENGYDINFLNSESNFNEKDIIIIFHSSFDDAELDQKLNDYINQGGDIIIFADPLSRIANTYAGSGSLSLRSSSLPNFIKKRGFSLSDGLEIYDSQLLTEHGTEDGTTLDPTVLSLGTNQFNPDHPITAGFDFVHFINSGALSAAQVEGYKNTALIRSSPYAVLLDINATLEADSAKVEQAMANITELDQGYPLAIIQESESESEGRLILVADIDWLHGSVAGFTDESGRVESYNSNLNLMRNMVGFLAGNPALGELRTRNTAKRPLYRWDELRQVINQPFIEPIGEISLKISEYESQLNRLSQARRVASTQTQRSNHIENQITDLRTDLRLANAELASLKKARDAKVQAHLSVIKWLNILLIPTLIVLLGIIITMIRSNKVKTVGVE